MNITEKVDELLEGRDPFSWGTNYDELVRRFKKEAKGKSKQELKKALQDLLKRNREDKVFDQKMVKQWNKEKKAYSSIMRHHGPDHALAVARWNDLSDKVKTQLQRDDWREKRMKNVQKLIDNLDEILNESRRTEELLEVTRTEQERALYRLDSKEKQRIQKVFRRELDEPFHGSSEAGGPSSSPLYGGTLGSWITAADIDTVKAALKKAGYKYTGKSRKNENFVRSDKDVTFKIFIRPPSRPNSIKAGYQTEIWHETKA